MRTRFAYEWIASDQSFVKWLVYFLSALLVLWLLALATSASAATITTMEYYIDSDPGAGNRTTIDIPPDSATIVHNKISGISTASLPAGSHLLFIRAKDSDENWGPWRQISFVTLFAGTGIQPVHIDRAEYFIDTDPGEGLGTPIQVPIDGQYDNLAESILVMTRIHQL